MYIYTWIRNLYNCNHVNSFHGDSLLSDNNWPLGEHVAPAMLEPPICNKLMLNRSTTIYIIYTLCKMSNFAACTTWYWFLYLIQGLPGRKCVGISCNWLPAKIHRYLIHEKIQICYHTHMLCGCVCLPSLPFW